MRWKLLTAGMPARKASPAKTRPFKAANLAAKTPAAKAAKAPPKASSAKAAKALPKAPSAKAARAPPRAPGIRTVKAPPDARRTTVKVARPKATATTTGPTEQAIRHRAYEIYLARGSIPGDPQQDWDAAVKELSAPRRKVASR